MRIVSRTIKLCEASRSTHRESNYCLHVSWHFTYLHTCQSQKINEAGRKVSYKCRHSACLSPVSSAKCFKIVELLVIVIETTITKVAMIRIIILPTASICPSTRIPWEFTTRGAAEGARTGLHCEWDYHYTSWHPAAYDDCVPSRCEMRPGHGHLSESRRKPIVATVVCIRSATRCEARQKARLSKV